MQNAGPDTSQPRAPWVSPEVHTLPRLTELTLATGGGIPGESGGSTVVGP